MERSPSGLRFVGEFVGNVRVPLAFIGVLAALPIANYRFGGAIPLPSFEVLILLRLGLVFWVGHLTTARSQLGTKAAAGSGALLFAIEQFVVISWFVLDGQIAAALRVAQNIAMFFWLPASVAAVGGLFGQQHRRVPLR